MSRTTQIARIIEQRCPLVSKIEGVERNLLNLAEALHHLEEHRTSLLSKLVEETARGRLEEIDCLTLSRSIETELLALGKLKGRFSRNTLNIGVVGRARQGKSRFLQSLTGLSTGEIPDGDRQHCTGVRSTIHHNSALETHGEVSFYTESSFLEEVIAPYYEKLGLGSKPLNLDSFANNPLPALQDNPIGYAEPKAMYEHLKRYHDNLDKYRPLLKTASPLRISQAEIREYVAQDTPDGERIFYNYLAVQEVKITCTFPNEEVGKIALVDMPGLGDTGIGDEERLVKTLGQEVDAVVFVRMPKSSGDYWADVDVRLYDIVRNSLVDLPINLWSFLILNRTDVNAKNGDNQNNCQDLADSLAEKHIDVVQPVIVNCASSEEANSFLDLILNYLVNNITSLDKQYASLCQERLIPLQTAVTAELNKASQALDIGTGRENWFPLFTSLFGALWNDTSSGLAGLLKELRNERNKQNTEFQEQVQAALQACKNDTGIPSEAEIEIRRNAVGGYPNAYYQYLNEVRAHLSQHFLLLDEGLKRALDQVKIRVAEVLINQANFDGLTDKRGAELISAIAFQLPDELTIGKPSRLKLGFKILAEFELSYRGMIQHRIRQHLDDLTPDETGLQLSSSPTAVEVLDCLQVLQSEAVYRCKTALDDFLTEPSQAAFAIVEEFIDRVLRAEGVKEEWQIFVMEVRNELWRDEFGQLGERTRISREWLDSVAKATENNQLSKMQFLS